MDKVATYLNKIITGNILSSKNVTDSFSTDHSIFKITPKYIAFPESTSDVQKLLRFINQLAEKKFRLPVAIRGTGLDTTGSDLSPSLIISTKKLNHIKEIDTHDMLVHVQSGVTLAELNNTLSTYGLTLPIKAHQDSTIGGLIANETKDNYYARKNGIRKYIKRIEYVLPNGDIIQSNPLKVSKLQTKFKQHPKEQLLNKKIYDLITQNEKNIIKIKDSNQRTGYYSIVDCIKNGNLDLMQLLFGSQGSLAFISEIILKVKPLPKSKQRILISFNSLKSASAFLTFIQTKQPLELNIYDTRIIEETKQHGKTPKILSNSYRQGFLFSITLDNSKTKNAKTCKECIEFLPKTAKIHIENKDNSAEFDSIENYIEDYLNNNTRHERISISDNFYIPKQELQSFIEDLEFLEEKYKMQLPVYGSYSADNYSIRPEINIASKSGKHFIVDYLNSLNNIIQIHEGSLCGGAPEGRFKALFTNKELGIEQKKLYKKIKEIYDENNILAPEIKLNVNPKNLSKYLRSEKNKIIYY